MVPEMLEYARSFIGAPYVWGGNGPQFDCSGFIQEILSSCGLDIPGDQTAQKLHDGLKRRCWIQSTSPGSLLFYGKSLEKITHVAMVLNGDQMIEAGGGDRSTNCIRAANSKGAMVRIRPIRSGFVSALAHI